MSGLYLSLYIVLGLLTAWVYRNHYRKRAIPLYLWLLLWIMWPIAMVMAIGWALKEWKV